MKNAYYMSFILLLNIGLSVTKSSAQDSKKGADKVVYDKNTKLDFEEREVDGQFMSPDGRDVSGEKNIYFDSMLEERKSFQKELRRSSEAIR
jgi:hypothetical protein